MPRGEAPECLETLALGQLRLLVNPETGDAGLDGELGLAVIIDVLCLERDRHVIAHSFHRVFDDARMAADGERDVSFGEDRQRDLRALAKPGQRAAAPPQSDQDVKIPCANGGGDRDRVGSVFDRRENADRLVRPVRQRSKLRALDAQFGLCLRRVISPR